MGVPRASDAPLGDSTFESADALATAAAGWIVRARGSELGALVLVVGPGSGGHGLRALLVTRSFYNRLVRTEQRAYTATIRAALRNVDPSSGVVVIAGEMPEISVFDGSVSARDLVALVSHVGRSQKVGS